MLQADEAYDRNLKSASGIVGTDGGRMLDYIGTGETLCGDFIGSVIAGALKMGEFQCLYEAYRSGSHRRSLRCASRGSDPLLSPL